MTHERFGSRTESTLDSSWALDSASAASGPDLEDNDDKIDDELRDQEDRVLVAQFSANIEDGDGEAKDADATVNDDENSAEPRLMDRTTTTTKAPRIRLNRELVTRLANVLAQFGSSEKNKTQTNKINQFDEEDAEFEEDETVFQDCFQGPTSAQQAAIATIASWPDRNRKQLTTASANTTTNLSITECVIVETTANNDQQDHHHQIRTNNQSIEMTKTKRAEIRAPRRKRSKGRRQMMINNEASNMRTLKNQIDELKHDHQENDLNNCDRLQTRNCYNFCDTSVSSLNCYVSVKAVNPLFIHDDHHEIDVGQDESIEELTDMTTQHDENDHQGKKNDQLRMVKCLKNTSQEDLKCDISNNKKITRAKTRNNKPIKTSLRKRQLKTNTGNDWRKFKSQHLEHDDLISSRNSTASSSSIKEQVNSAKYLLLSTILALLFLFCSSNPRMSVVESREILQQSHPSDGGQLMPDADLNAAILATMSNQQPQSQASAAAAAIDQSSLYNDSNNGFQPFISNRSSLLSSSSSSINNSSLSAGTGNSIQQQQMMISKQSGAADSANVNSLLDSFLTIGRIFIMGAIIIGDICGNSLVIISVCRHSKLRVTTNWFVVSLACADILVALFAMTFNASVIISGKWLFKPWVCDFWNSCDVLASTASILHLCCISIDRYIAITRPLDYPMKITTKRVMYALCVVWLSSALLSYLPIFTGIYTTTEHLEWIRNNPDQCEFVVNRVYAIVSSSISFWIPCCIMVFTYYRIYKEASRQEKLIYKSHNIKPAPMVNHHPHAQQHQHSAPNYQQQQMAANSKQRRSKSMALTPSQAEAGRGSSSQDARIRQLAAAQQLQQFETKTTTLSSSSQQGQQIATTQLTDALDATEKQPLNNNNNSVTDSQQQQPISDDQSKPMINSGENDKNNNNTTTSTTVTNQESNNENKKNSNDSTSAAPTSGPTAAPLPLTITNDFGAPPSKKLLHQNQKKQHQIHNSQKKIKATLNGPDEEDDFVVDFDPRDSNSGQSTPTKSQSISKMKREHKAAKTLGIIMGVFILCWLPFFSWYTPSYICGHACDGIVPHQAVTILFWIGYFNSTLNPIIYAYFNSEFRDAFKKTLQWLFCCCQDLKCLRVNRANDNQHYNCTYRSTQEIVLVSNG